MYHDMSEMRILGINNQRKKNYHEVRLYYVENAQVFQLLDNQHLLQRLKRTKPFIIIIIIIIIWYVG
jgi:hypothetical protein